MRAIRLGLLTTLAVATIASVMAACGAFESADDAANGADAAGEASTGPDDATSGDVTSPVIDAGPSTDASPVSDSGDSEAGDPGDPNRIVQVAAGGVNACARTAGGRVFCWGAQAGVLPGPASTSCGTTADIGCSNGPVEMSFGAAATDVSVGRNHVCIVDVDGGVACRGSSVANVLPGEDTDGGLYVVPVPRAHQVSVGVGNACAVVDGINGGTAVWCWGDNVDGIRGSSAATGPTPTQVNGLDNASKVTLALGDWLGCALVNGKAYCWGHDGHGALGTPPPPEGPCTDPDAGMTCTATPVAIDAGSVIFDDLGASLGTVCARSGTAVWCWGDNTLGTAGQDAGPAILPPTRAHFNGGDVQQLSMGFLHGCATILKPAGGSEMWCWGSDEGFEQGREHLAVFTNPALGYATPPGKASSTSSASVSQVASGYYFTVVLDQAGDVYVFGLNTVGTSGHVPGPSLDTPCALNPSFYCTTTVAKLTFPL